MERATDGPRPSEALSGNEQAVCEIAARHKAFDVRVFGSVLRGEDQPGSDLDLLVKFQPDASLFDQARLRDALEELLGVPVDVLSENGLGSRLERVRSDARPLLPPEPSRDDHT